MRVRTFLALLAALVVLAGVAGCGLFGGGPEPVAKAFAEAWAKADDEAAGRLTDNAITAAAQLRATREALAPSGLTVTVGQVREATDKATASMDVTWALGPGRTWHYLGSVELVRADKAEHGWLVHWAPSVVHPDLGAGQRLAVSTTPAEPGPVLDRAGVPLLSATPVVTVLLDRLAAGDLPTVTGALAAALRPIDDRITQQSITDGAARTPDGQGYTVAVLRRPDYERVKNAIHDLPGVRFTSSDRLLGPAPAFGQQVLPGVRTEMAAQIDGVPGWGVRVVDQSGQTVRPLVDEAPKAGTAVSTGLDRAIQAAAEDAVEPLPQQAMLVAISPSTGDVLAVAQNGPADTGGALALTGRYPPGSTFKIATAVAAVGTEGLTVDSPVACPGQTVIGGRAVPNEDRFALGTVPLRQAFARSCNTTFAQLGSTLAADALPTAARTLGLGADYAVPGILTVTGSVPVADDPVLRAENGFGQGRVLASPFGMALVAATVAHAAPVVPQLIRGRPTAVTTPATQPDPAVLAQVRTMMRAVVTEGTATRLNALGEVYGKTGTAEFDLDGRRGAHGWFAGFRGDVALAVLVVDGGSSAPAVDAAGRFLAAIGG
ncbi:penicillin-binding transpeptidase domain-containing protein [Pseudonocardia sp. CA-107938]|uniref:penicillin-binding transpeptidase domain-containing protein n=1 Tax=Pseudonocardia sp. CA-107938 TaxID=3240021 RepID=UPI003D928ECE